MIYYHCLFVLVVCCFLSLVVRDSEAALGSCKDNKCKQNAKCVEQPDTVYGYSCICPPGYFGLNCDAKLGVYPSRNDDDDDDDSIEHANVPHELKDFAKKYPCENGGILVKEGLPCKCLPGFTGRRCELVDQRAMQTFCSSYPCLNGGTCRPAGAGSFYCTCPTGYSGVRCEYSRTRRTGNVLGASVGSSFSSLLLMAVVAFCIYQCCLKRGSGINVNQRPGGGGGFPFSAASIFNRGGGAGFGGPAAGFARPMGPPGSGGGFQMIPTRPVPGGGGGFGGGGLYPMQPMGPHMGPPGPHQMPPPPGQPGFYPVYQPHPNGVNQLYKPPDPDEAFRVNAAPPSYDEVTKTSQPPHQQQLPPQAPPTMTQSDAVTPQTSAEANK